MKIKYFFFSLLLVAGIALQAKADSLSFHDQWISQGVPAKALDQALAYKNPLITNNEWLLIADFTEPSTQQRLFVMNLKTGELYKTFVTHGEGSDDGSGVNAVKFSNIDDSSMTSSGFIRISDPIKSPTFGMAFRLEGLEDRNNLVAARMIIMHSADYTSSEYIAAHGHPGMSQGCPAIPPSMLHFLYSRDITGSLFYSYTADDAKN